MNPLIITAFTIGGAIAGYFLCALMTAGKVGDVQIAEDEHRRAADALTTKNQRIERALECVTENSAHVGKKMAAILRGER